MFVGELLSRGVSRAIRKSGVVTALILVLISSTSQTSAQNHQRRVLFLYPDSEIPAVTAVSEAVHKKLAAQPSLNIKTFREFLDLSRFPNEAHKQLTLRYLARKYAQTKLDLVLALGPDSLQIAVANRDRLAPGAPIVFCCVSPSTLALVASPDNVTGIVSEFDAAKTVALARSLQPLARQLVVVAGDAPFDRRWIQMARNQLRHEQGLDIRYLAGLPRDLLLDEVAKLPADTIVLMLTIFKDGTGKDFVPVEIAEEVAKASGAPVYSPYASLVGRGFVGGHSDSFEEIGAQTGQLMLRILRGEITGRVLPEKSTTATFRVDARQLKRWSFSEGDLPADTIVLHKSPSMWQQHRALVIAVATILAGMTTILSLLLLQIVRRRNIEVRLRASEERLGFAAASAGIGLWQYDPRADQLWSSEHCRAMFGVGAHSVLTTGALIKAVHPDDRRVAIASIRAATFGNLTDGVGEFRVVGAKGEIRWLQARGRTSLDASGRPTRISGIFRDISGYKAAQKETELLFRRLMTIQDEERQRIAQELHDSTAQHIAAACLNLIALRGTGDGKPASSRIFQDTEDCLEQASRELRAFTYLLNPPELAKDGFSATLRRYVEGFRRRTGLAVSLRLNGASDHLSAALQQPFLRIIQEALANVHRHAAATCVSIRLSHVAGRVHLVIVDDGRGVMDKESPQRNRSELLPSGVGLAGMTARAQQFGGTLNVRSKRPRGTAVHVVVPIGSSKFVDHSDDLTILAGE